MLRDNLAGLIEPMRAARELASLALFTEQKKSSDDRLQDALKIPAPKGRNLTLTENAASPFHAEPRQSTIRWNAAARFEIGQRHRMRPSRRRTTAANCLRVLISCAQQGKVRDACCGAPGSRRGVPAIILSTPSKCRPESNRTRALYENCRCTPLKDLFPNRRRCYEQEFPSSQFLRRGRIQRYRR